MEHGRNISSCGSTSSTNAHAREGGLPNDVRVPGAISPARVLERIRDAPAAAHGRPPLGEKLLLVFGPPGTGKTTRLLDLLRSELEAGTPSTEIAFVTFTRAARSEARGRVLQEFHVGGDDLPWFRTIHSAAYRLLGLNRSQVMDHSRWREFAGRHGYDLTETSNEDADDDPFAPPTRTEDDLLRAVVQWAANRRLDIEAALGRSRINAPAAQVRLFAERLESFKREHGLLDFSDMLERVIAAGLRPDVSVAFVDEAQDLSPLQIAVVERWFRDCERVYVAGDDDQAVYDFQGAEPAWLLSLNARSTVVEVLRRSYRVPAQVHRLAGRIIRQNRTRVTKPYEARTEPGKILVLPADHVLAAVGDATSVFVLARNRVFLGSWAERLLDAGEPFVAEGRAASSPLDDPAVARAVTAGLRLREGKSVGARDLEALLRFIPSRGAGLLPHGVKKRAERNRDPVTRAELESDWGLGRLLEHLDTVGPVQVLLKLRPQDRKYLERLLGRHAGKLPEPRFRLATIHASKGREADVVVVVPDMTRASWEQYVQGGRDGEEAENRVAYVAVTRARRCLILVEPSTKRFYPYARFLKETAPEA